MAAETLTDLAEGGPGAAPGVLRHAASPQQLGERWGVFLGWELANRAELEGCLELGCCRAGLPHGDLRPVKCLVHG